MTVVTQFIFKSVVSVSFKLLVSATAQDGIQNAAGIALDDPKRNYKDELHKPELIYALSDPFIALAGFRSLDAVRAELHSAHIAIVHGDDDTAFDPLRLATAMSEAGADQKRSSARLRGSRHAKVTHCSSPSYGHVAAP